MSEIWERMKARNEALMRSKQKEKDQMKPKVTMHMQPNESNDIGKALLVLAEEDYVVNRVQVEPPVQEQEVQGGNSETFPRWFDGLKGGARDEASKTEQFLIQQLAQTREETSRAQANSLLLQQQLNQLQTELQSVREMVRASNKNVEESEKVLQRVQDASLEIVRTRSEMVLIQEQTAAAALKAKAFEQNAETSARTAQDAVAVQTMRKTRVMHGELERALKLEEQYRKKAEEGHKLLDEERKVLNKLKADEKEKRDEADLEQGRYSKLKSYAEILVMNAQTASVASAEANEKLAFLLANETKAQETLTKYKEHAREVIAKSKKFESDAIRGKRDQETVQKIAEIHAYETETATVLVQTMKLIEKLRDKIEKALARAKEAEASASQKAIEAKKSQDALLEYESVLKKALNDAMAALRDLRDEEVKFEKVRSDSIRYDDEYERAKTDARLKSSATIESEDEARKALREMQIGAGQAAATGSEEGGGGGEGEREEDPSKDKTQDQLYGGSSEKKKGVFSKITQALKNLKKKNVLYVSGGEFQERVAKELAGGIKVDF
jgi:hypothetical protein